jgi:hypothetical protein
MVFRIVDQIAGGEERFIVLLNSSQKVERLLLLPTGHVHVSHFHSLVVLSCRQICMLHGRQGLEGSDQEVLVAADVSTRSVFARTPQVVADKSIDAFLFAFVIPIGLAKSRPCGFSLLLTLLLGSTAAIIAIGIWFNKQVSWCPPSDQTKNISSHCLLSHQREALCSS